MGGVRLAQLISSAGGGALINEFCRFRGGQVDAIPTLMDTTFDSKFNVLIRSSQRSKLRRLSKFREKMPEIQIKIIPFRSHKHLINFHKIRWNSSSEIFLVWLGVQCEVKTLLSFLTGTSSWNSSWTIERRLEKSTFLSTRKTRILCSECLDKMFVVSMKGRCFV